MRYFLALLFLTPSLVFAQVNIESSRGGGKQGFTGNLDVGFERKTGNTDVLSYILKTRLDYVSGKHHTFLQLERSEGSSRGVDFKDEAFGHARWTMMFGGWYGSDLFVQSQYDTFKDLMLRQLEGGYLRIVAPLFAGEVAVGLGAMAEFERLKGGGGEGFSARYTSYLSLTESLSQERVKISLTGYYQPKIKDLSDYRMTFIGQIEVLFFDKSFSLVPSASYAYDSRPPVGVVVDDSQTTLYLRYRW